MYNCFFKHTATVKQQSGRTQKCSQNRTQSTGTMSGNLEARNRAIGICVMLNSGWFKNLFTKLVCLLICTFVLDLQFGISQLNMREPSIVI